MNAEIVPMKPAHRLEHLSEGLRGLLGKLQGMEVDIGYLAVPSQKIRDEIELLLRAYGEPAK